MDWTPSGFLLDPLSHMHGRLRFVQYIESYTAHIYLNTQKQTRFTYPVCFTKTVWQTKPVLHMLFQFKATQVQHTCVRVTNVESSNKRPAPYNTIMA